MFKIKSNLQVWLRELTVFVLDILVGWCVRHWLCHVDIVVGFGDEYIMYWLLHVVGSVVICGIDGGGMFTGSEVSLQTSVICAEVRVAISSEKWSN